MKKLYTTLIASTIALHSFAQWTTVSGKTTTTDIIGIGTTAPTKALHLLGTAANTTSAVAEVESNNPNGVAAVQIYNDAGGYFQFANWGSTFAGNSLGTARAGNGMLEYNGAGSLILGTKSASTIGIVANSARAMTILPSGYVGIGSTTPSARLTVQGSYADIHLQATGGGANLWSMVSSNNADGSFQIASGSTSAANAKFTILSTGQVGIGTTTPTNNLQIGSLSPIASTSPPTLSLGGAYSSDHGLNPKLKVYDDGAHFWGLGSSSKQLDYIVDGNTYDHVFYAAGNELLRIKGSGNVAIGTVDPKGYKLAVNGSVIATSVTVKLYNNWPDFVFEKNYHLPTLASVKNYIDQNQHLPDMPSHREVAEKGVNLGEMNRLLLKKVEELTLYAIEQQKKLELQEARMKVLEGALLKEKN